MVTLIFLLILPFIEANPDAARLYDDLLRKNEYSKNIRPVKNSSETVQVKLGLKLSQLINVQEKNEIITISMWVLQEWMDYSLRWDPAEYGNVTEIFVPSESIWLPDIVLYNNADGEYTVTTMTKATINYYGKVRWKPPATYKSQCDIDVAHFPFDEQECELKFSSWTYDALMVDLVHISSNKYIMNKTDVMVPGIDLTVFYPSTEWDLMSVSAKKNIKYYPCCPEAYPDITFVLILRRKTLFYSINLIMPCVTINVIALLVFYLPSESGEKISLTMSLLLSLSMFQLLLMEMVPATSNSTPILAKYILFTMIAVSISVLMSVVALNVNFRTATRHEFPEGVRDVFINRIPKYIGMERPIVNDELTVNTRYDFSTHEYKSDLAQILGNPYKDELQFLNSSLDDEDESNSYKSTNATTFVDSSSLLLHSGFRKVCSSCSRSSQGQQNIPSSVKKAIDGLIYIPAKITDGDQKARVMIDWMYVALVIDRILFIAYFIVCSVTTMAILFESPIIFANDPPMKKYKKIE